MKDNYILDSSIWIALERGLPSVCERALPLIRSNKVCLVDVIVAEILRGTKTRKDFLTLKRAFQNFRWLSTRWENVADLAFTAAQQGFQPPLVDLYIAQCAIENKKVLVTQDRHFSHIAKGSPLKHILLKG